MNCKSCGKKLTKTNKFCPACGQKVEEVVIDANVEEKVETVDNKEEVKDQPTTSNNETKEIKKPTGAFAAAIIVTILSFLSLNFIALILGIVAIVYLCMYKEEKVYELKERKIKNGKTINIISWVIYGIGMIIRIIAIICIVIPIMFVVENYSKEDYDWDYEYEEEYEEELPGNYSYDNLIEINYDKLMSLYKGKTKSIVVVVQTNCGYCNLYKPIIDEAAYNENLDIYILDINTLTDTEYNNMLNNIDYFRTHETWGTPTTLIVSSSETLDYLEGYTDYATTIEFYKNNSLID